jgi:hypothetical protein
MVPTVVRTCFILSIFENTSLIFFRANFFLFSFVPQAHQAGHRGSGSHRFAALSLKRFESHHAYTQDILGLVSVLFLLLSHRWFRVSTPFFRCQHFS